MRLAPAIWALLAALIIPLSARADPPASYKVHYRQALAAYDEGDLKGYLSALEQMAAGMPALGTSVNDDLNRPFLQYHLARAYALNDQNALAIKWLNTVLQEGIEGLLISQAAHDSAFEAVRATRDWRSLEKKMAKAPIATEALGGPLYMLEGAGCTLVASVGPDGVVLVDTGYAPAAQSIGKAIKKLGGDDVTIIINTHLHADHVGGNAALGKDAIIIAHPTTRAGMMEGETFIDQTLPAAPTRALPTMTTRAPLSIYANGEEIRIIPLPGHTEGDVIVHFTRSRVIHMGDRYFPQPGKPTFPYPGEDLRAYLAAMDALMATLGEDGAVISGHNQPVPFLHLKMSYEALTRAVAWVEAGIEAGKSFETLQAEGVPKDWNEWSHGRPEQWLTYLYEQLKEG